MSKKTLKLGYVFHHQLPVKKCLDDQDFIFYFWLLIVALEPVTLTRALVSLDPLLSEQLNTSCHLSRARLTVNICLLRGQIVLTADRATLIEAKRNSTSQIACIPYIHT